MRDEFEGRFWGENHMVMSDAIGRAIDKLAYMFKNAWAKRLPARRHRP